MNAEELREELEKIGVPKRWYAINGHLCSDRHMLNFVHTYWEYFYFDERGGVNSYKKFNSENEACTYFLEKMKTTYELVRK